MTAFLVQVVEEEGRVPLRRRMHFNAAMMELNLRMHRLDVERRRLEMADAAGADISFSGGHARLFTETRSAPLQVRVYTT